MSLADLALFIMADILFTIFFYRWLGAAHDGWRILASFSFSAVMIAYYFGLMGGTGLLFFELDPKVLEFDVEIVVVSMVMLGFHIWKC